MNAIEGDILENTWAGVRSGWGVEVGVGAGVDVAVGTGLGLGWTVALGMGVEARDSAVAVVVGSTGAEDSPPPQAVTPRIEARAISKHQGAKRLISIESPRFTSVAASLEPE